MTLPTLLIIMVIALAGPLLSWASRWRTPVLVGQILGGALIGSSGLRLVDPSDPALTLLADIGFALTMFVAGSQIPLRSETLRAGLGRALARAALVAASAVGLGALIGWMLHSPDWLVYAVVLGSSSAALAVPAMQQGRLGGAPVTDTIAQIALADALSMIALPLVIGTDRALFTAVGALVLCLLAGIAVLTLRWARRRGMLARVHHVSHREHLALELRGTLIVLLLFATLAVQSSVSIMLAGFAAGVIVAAIGEPRRLARQVFALSDGFFSPLFYVWLGASLSLGELWSTPEHLVLGVGLAAGGVLVHLAGCLLGQPVSLAILAGAQLGVPVAAAAIGTQTGVLGAAESAALVVSALISVIALSATVPLAARRFASDARGASIGS